MGLDFEVFLKNLELIKKGAKLSELIIPPSVKIAQQIIKKTGFLIATEIMDPLLQIPLYEKLIPKNKLLLWNPAVMQLGWPILIMSKFIKKNKWYLGIKNPKWLGDYLKRANNPNYQKMTQMEKTWEGLVSYSGLNKKRIILIHRGVDVPEKKDYRNSPIHYIAMRVKKSTGYLLFFDPSHSLGPKMKEKIVPETIKAMKLKINEKEYLYDGILIEVGKSETDSEQHISIDDLKYLIEKIAEFRSL
ncbi:MAG: hypothetical protein C4278_00045 [Patescibacteria group bacterium]